MSSSVNIALVPVEGDLDVTTAPAVRRRIDRLVSGGCRRVLLNLADTGHVDSAGLGLILTELRRMRGLGGLLSLVNVSDQVYLALRRMRVLDFIADSLPAETHLSLMRQYAPTPNVTEPPLNRRLTDREYARAVDYCCARGFTNVWIQGRESASLAYTPDFDAT